MPSLPPTESAPPAPSPTAIEISCTPDAQAPAYLGDPCPAATVAVELAVAPVRLPLARVVIEPGPFFCDDVWPGAGVEAPCYAPMVQPGQFMHAWVSFEKSSEIAAVMVGRDLPTEIGSPPPTAPPWTATLVTVEVPPAGWSMPTSRVSPTELPHSGSTQQGGPQRLRVPGDLIALFATGGAPCGKRRLSRCS